MEILKANRAGIGKAIKIIKNRGIVVYPTDTAYALGGIFDSPAVNYKILRIKNRRDKKFTLIASGLMQVKKFFTLRGLQIKLAKKYWPGPLSIVVSNRFAVRVPKSKISQALARGAGKPLIATSANLTGKKTNYSIADILKHFTGKKYQPDLILDGGNLIKKRTSTIVKVKNGKIEILRQGEINVSVR